MWLSIIEPTSQDASDLPRGSRLELYRQLSRDAPRWATTVFHVYALCLSPLADCGAVSPFSGGPAFVRAGRGGSAPTREPQPRSAPAHLAASGNARRSGGSRTPCRPGELDGIVSLAAVKVTDEERLCLLGHHVCSVPVSGLGDQHSSSVSRVMRARVLAHRDGRCPGHVTPWRIPVRVKRRSV
jgi:hypothetical protein